MRSTLTLILTILATFCQGECPIECYCDRVTTCTGDKLLNRFPKIYTFSLTTTTTTEHQAVTRLEVHEYAVKHLTRSDFLQIISNLSELSLTRNSLESVDNETFSLSPSLHQVPSTSTTGEQEDILKLRVLDLSQNKLKYFVGGGLLKRLKILDLSSNLLQQVYELSAIESLESVNLHSNRISYLQPATFQNLRYLQYINLDSNSLRLFDPSTFSNLPALGHLILSSNPVSNLVPGFFWNSRVQFVDVSNVGLASIPPSLTKTIRDFRCANNNLTIIRQTDFESYPNVGLLVLDENQIEVVEEDAFGRLEFLTRLWMNGNRLKFVPQSLPPTLQSLHLEDNRILNLSSSEFRNLRNLQELNLHGNRISSLPPFVFAELTSLKNLDLRSNTIDVIYRDSFSNLSNLVTLDLSHNPLKVMVTGAWLNLGNLNLLHLSRLPESIEFDTTSFSPLQKLQILELDDSPHFTQKLIQDSALSHLGNLRELNLQRCELDDLNRVRNALAELNLQVVKLSGNPWDCRDLYGSAFHELMNRVSVVDGPTCEQPPNLRGVPLSSVNFSLLSPQTTQSSPEELEEEENLLDFTELTPDLVDQHEEPEQISYSSSGSSTSGGSSATASGSASDKTNATTQSNSNSAAFTSLDKVTNAPNTNSPENAPHAFDANVNPFRSTSLPAPPSGLAATAEERGPPTKNLTRATTSVPATSTSRANVNATVVPMSRNRNNKGSANVSVNVESNYKVSTTNRPHDLSGSWNADTIPAIDGKNISISSSRIVSDSSGDADAVPNGSSLDLDSVPTRSYFDSNWKNSHGVETRTKSISSGGGTSGNKKPAPAILIPIGARTRTASLDKTKTNDDNTIIDESGRRGSPGSGGDSARYHSKARPDDGEETGPKSIDGFPSDSDVDGLSPKENELPTSILNSKSGSRKSSPKAFYLRRDTETSRNQQPTTSGGAIIVKTLVISALSCLASVLLLLFTGYAVYKIYFTRSRTFFCGSVTNRTLEEDFSSNSSPNRSDMRNCAQTYTRFGRKSDSQKDFDSDSDQVELSGITNRLYMENEEIFHIT